jgi:hypothetical protein
MPKVTAGLGSNTLLTPDQSTSIASPNE